MPDAKIYSIQAREILDSRGNPTLEVTVILNSGYRGVASVPSGASVSSHEALELRDGDPKRFDGMGVLKAIANVTTKIQPTLKNVDSLDQGAIDKKLVEFDGTENKNNLGANAILGVSLATAIAASAHQKIPLYRYVNNMARFNGPIDMSHLPTPIFNVINGGKHGAGNLDFQEFQIIPATNKTFSQGLQMCAEIYQATKKILLYRNAVHSVGDEGGFAPNLFTNTDPLEILSEAIKSANYRTNFDVFFGLDVASSHFASTKGYQIKDRAIPFQTKEFIEYFQKLHESYHLLLLEDALDEDDWDGWILLTKSVGDSMLVVGDDLLATNIVRCQRAIAEKACSAFLVKPNQIGTLSEFLAVVQLARQNEIKIIASHRSGETNDSWIADVAVGVGADYVKFGAPARGERVAKYNRLLQIENELRS